MQRGRAERGGAAGLGRPVTLPRHGTGTDCGPPRLAATGPVLFTMQSRWFRVLPSGFARVWEAVALAPVDCSASVTNNATLHRQRDLWEARGRVSL